MKQTAIDWLLDNLISEPYSEKDFEHNEKCWDKAKEMEKEQIEFAYADGFANGFDDGKYDDEPNYIDNEDYYNETFKSE